MNNLELAKNRNTFLETLKILATDADWNVRYGVAMNYNTPLYIKQYLYYYDY